jgi:hypothetical protein
MSTDLTAGLTPFQSYAIWGFVVAVLLIFARGCCALFDDLAAWLDRRQVKARRIQLAADVLRNVVPVSVDRERELATLMGHQYSPQDRVIHVQVWPPTRES